jgi:hypothetical protein
LARGPEFLHNLQHQGKGGFGVDRATSIYPAIFNATIEWVIRHVFHTHGIEVNIDGYGSIGGAFEARVHVAAAIFNLVNHNVGPESLSVVS